MIYAFALIDRVNLPNARIAGMDEDLQLSVGARYSLIVMIFFVRDHDPKIFLAFTLISLSPGTLRDISVSRQHCMSPTRPMPLVAISRCILGYCHSRARFLNRMDTGDRMQNPVGHL